MANPQLEKGYTKIVNKVLKKLYESPLSGGEFRVALCIIRKTWGWNKVKDKISLNQLVTETKLSKKTVCESVNKLVTKRLLYKTVDKSGNFYTFNKNYDEWVVTERLMGSYEKVTTSKHEGSYGKVTYKRKKEIIQKKEDIFKKNKKKFVENISL